MIDARSLFFATVLLGASYAASAQTSWDFPTGYSANSFQTENVVQFTKDVEKASNGKLKMTVHANGSLYKANEIKRAVQTGQAQIGEFLLSGAANENPLFGVDAIPFLASSYPDARRLSDASRPALEKVLAAQGLKLLFVSPWPGQSLYSSKPIASVADLRGTKMRTYNPATTRIAQLVKAQPATIQLSELGQALATGAVDNFLTSNASGVENKLYEQVKNFYEVNAWLPKNGIVVSQKAFEALNPAIQETVLNAAREAEARAWKVSQEKSMEFTAQLAANGMKVGTPGAAFQAELKTIGETMTAEWLKTAGDQGRQIVETYRKH
jgi:TRAP-type C4-dicarboxylate transport system substrate-binding protein